MEGGVECGRASDAQNPTRCKSLYPTRKSNAVAVVRANPTRKSNAKVQRGGDRCMSSFRGRPCPPPATCRHHTFHLSHDGPSVDA